MVATSFCLRSLLGMVANLQFKKPRNIIFFPMRKFNKSLFLTSLEEQKKNEQQICLCSLII